MVLAASPEGGKPGAASASTNPPPPGQAASSSRVRGLIDSHCHLADEAFADDLEDGRRGGRGRPAWPAALCILAPATPRRRGRRRACGRLWPEVRFAVGRPSAPGARVRRRAAEVAARWCEAACARMPRRRRDRRDRPRLPLRLLAARRAAARSSRRRSRWPASCGCRSSSTRARPTTTRSRILREEGGAEVRGRLPLLHGDRRAGARRARPRASALSFAGIVTFPKAEALRAIAAAVPGRPAAGRDRQPVPGAGAASRQAERAGAWVVARRRSAGGRARHDGAELDGRSSTANFDALLRRPEPRSRTVAQPRLSTPRRIAVSR